MEQQGRVVVQLIKMNPYDKRYDREKAKKELRKAELEILELPKYIWEQKPIVSNEGFVLTREQMQLYLDYMHTEDKFVSMQGA